MTRQALRVASFVVAIAFCLTPFASPPIALAIGIVVGLGLGHPFPERNGAITRVLLQSSVVALGFGMQLGKVVAAGRTGFVFTLATIVGTLALGLILGRLLRVKRTTAHLIASGTAICGGSAIAAVGPVIGADEDEMSVSLGTVFILNAIALFAFPPIGAHFSLTQEQFGMWAAIAIHDTSSVVGAATRYGQEALQIATTVKLARALWIIPLTLFTAWLFKRRSTRVTIPWFILFFVIACIIRTLTPGASEVWDLVVRIARIGLTVTLFLIGAGLTRQSLAAVGFRALSLGVVLWLTISIVAFLAVVRTV